MRFLQDYLKGKRGEWECKNCGMRGLYSCLNATKSHLSGSGCDGVRILFGLKGGEKWVCLSGLKKEIQKRIDECKGDNYQFVKGYQLALFQLNLFLLCNSSEQKGDEKK